MFLPFAVDYVAKTVFLPKHSVGERAIERSGERSNSPLLIEDEERRMISMLMFGLIYRFLRVQSRLCKFDRRVT